MKAIEQMRRLVEMHRLIKIEKTGTPVEFAKSLGISRSQLYVDIECLRSKGVTIDYSRQKRSFFYRGQKQIVISFQFGVQEKGV